MTVELPGMVPMDPMGPAVNNGGNPQFSVPRDDDYRKKIIG